MADPVEWPASLPGCAQDWSEDNEPDVLRSTNDVGLPKVRRRSTLRNKTVNIQWTMRAEQYTELMFFFETTCQQGVIPFNYAHPITGEINAYFFQRAPVRSFIAGPKGVGAFRVNCTLELSE